MRKNFFNVYRLYIGSNNLSKVTEIDKAILILNRYFKAYSLLNSVGFWNGIKENSFIVELSDSINEVIEKAKLLDVIAELKKELSQEAILLTQQKQEAIFI